MAPGRRPGLALSAPAGGRRRSAGGGHLSPGRLPRHSRPRLPAVRLVAGAAPLRRLRQRRCVEPPPAPCLCPSIDDAHSPPRVRTCAAVLASTFMLYSVGLGAGAAIPTAGALNWVLKDGIGQLGTLLFGRFLAHNFDVNSRLWYLLASAKLNLAIG